MMTRRLSTRQDDAGFTLIELLVVIIIIGILAAIAIPVFLNQRDKGYNAQATSDARNVATLEETYLSDNEHYKTEADIAAASADLGYRRSANVTSLSVKTFDVDGSAAVDGAGGYCIAAASTTGSHFYFSSSTGAVTTSAC